MMSLLNHCRRSVFDVAYFSLVAKEYAALGTRITLYLLSWLCRADSHGRETMSVVLGVSSNRRNGMIKESSLVDASRGTMK